MEQLIMSRTERTRLEVFARVKSKQIDKVKAAALLGLSYRQVLRSYARYAARGAAGLAHASRGRPSNRGHDAAHREKVLAAYAARYADFGPTLAAEYLGEKHGVVVSKESVRQILMEAGVWKRKRRRVEEIHVWRARRPCCGCQYLKQAARSRNSHRFSICRAETTLYSSWPGC